MGTLDAETVKLRVVFHVANTDQGVNISGMTGRQHREPIFACSRYAGCPHARTKDAYRAGWMSTATSSPEVTWAIISFSLALRGTL